MTITTLEKITIASQIKDLTQIVEGMSLGFTVGDGKTLSCAVVKTGRWHYSGSNYAVLEFKPCAGVKGCLRIDLGSPNAPNDICKAVDKAFANRFALVEYCKNPSLFSDSVKTWTDWGNGWEWREGMHSLQPDGSRCESNSQHIRIMGKVPNRQPYELAYFSKSVNTLPFI